MTYANILAIASGKNDDTAVLAAAGDIARLHQGVARVLAAYPPMPANVWNDGFGATYYAAETWEALVEAQQAFRRTVVAKAEAAADAAKIPFGPGDGGGRMELAQDCPALWIGLARELPLTDLVVAGHGSVKGDWQIVGVIDEAVMAGRSPLLVVRGHEPVAGGTAVVAWDGSAQAGRAARAAAPLLRNASRTLILQDVARLDEGERDHADPERLAAYLRLRGVPAVSIQRLSGETPQSLEAVAQSAGARLLVAGAYGHSRLREAVLGGATRAFLASDEGPHLFLAH